MKEIRSGGEMGSGEEIRSGGEMETKRGDETEKEWRMIRGANFKTQLLLLSSPFSLASFPLSLLSCFHFFLSVLFFLSFFPISFAFSLFSIVTSSELFLLFESCSIFLTVVCSLFLPSFDLFLGPLTS